MASSARLEELKKKFDENPRRYFAPLANEYRKQGDLPQAIALCRAHLPNQPGHLSGHVVLAQALFETHELTESRVIFEQALELDPENLIALRTLGDIASMQGEPSAARTWYERLLEVDPRNDAVASMLREIAASVAMSSAVADPGPSAVMAPGESGGDDSTSGAASLRSWDADKTPVSSRAVEESSDASGVREPALEPAAADFAQSVVATDGAPMVDSAPDASGNTIPADQPAEPFADRDIPAPMSEFVVGVEPTMDDDPDHSPADDRLAFEEDASAFMVAQNLSDPEAHPVAYADDWFTAPTPAHGRAAVQKSESSPPTETTPESVTVPTASAGAQPGSTTVDFDMFDLVEDRTASRAAPPSPEDQGPDHTPAAQAPDTTEVYDSWFAALSVHEAAEPTSGPDAERSADEAMAVTVNGGEATDSLGGEVGSEAPDVVEAVDEPRPGDADFGAAIGIDAVEADETGGLPLAHAGQQPAPEMEAESATADATGESVASSAPAEASETDDAAGYEGGPPEVVLEEEPTGAEIDCGVVAGTIAEVQPQVAGAGVAPQSSKAFEDASPPSSDVLDDVSQAPAAALVPEEAVATAAQQVADEESSEATEPPMSPVAEGLAVEHANEADFGQPVARESAPGTPANNESIGQDFGDTGGAEPFLAQDHGDVVESAQPAWRERKPQTARVDDSLPEMFVTETMADLYIQQGYLDEALQVYRKLLDRTPSDESLRARIAELESGTGRVGPPPALDRSSLSVRVFFGRIARRQSPRRPSESALDVESLGAQMASRQAAEETPSQLAAPTLSDLFADSGQRDDDDAAARRLASALGASEGAGRPARVAESELSLDHLFRDVPPESSDAVTLDAFFAAEGSEVPEASSPAQAPEDEERSGDIEQFTAWLEGLKKK